MRIQGANVLLTGASSGIGRALAVELARRGAKRVALVARRAEALEETARDVRAAGAEARIAPADVGERASIERVVREAEAAFGGLDVVIANAGIGNGGRKIDGDALEQLTRVNFLGAAWTLLAAADGMAARGKGQLVAVTSLAALRGLPVSTEYSATKAALDVLLEGWRVQLKPKGVAVTTIQPGFVDTPINQHMPSRPFLLTADDGARRMADAIERGDRVYAFPFPTATAMRVVGLLPGWLYDRVATRLVPKGRS